MKNLLILFTITAVLSSCVSSQVYEDLKDKNKSLRAENESLMARLDGTSNSNTDAYSVANLQKEVANLTTEKTRLAMELAAAKVNMATLQASYDALEANSSEALTENLERNRKLLKQLEAKEKALAEEEARLRTLEKKLKDRSQRVEELEGIIAAKDAKMRALKDAISAALTNFEGNGLTVEQRDGKVYVSMENKLLFDSGSWAVNSRGRQAVEQLGAVLAKNTEIAVLIEGHTDNVPYGGNGNITNNWDLSTKRATAIVEILTENSSIPKDNLTAAGRGEFAPVAPNTSAAGKAKNRRIEIILTPKLDEINKLLNEM
ncbi:MAG: cell envelope biogenesis protein OmpA [Flavobacteriaceae bacterium]|nr:cell envelope biogenesis protein OmpA [Flavobacteriaceae bacterium]